ncbi:putative MFS family arabinose efflux permease [Psychrobacter luti]|uniref:Putative MFS family arabinose efflux permease n=1 Tax=Psychrobacter luti TaxID=198481 RepID=A0A839TEW8_9GAMM|nr:MFS transporter [Psychrobacter luti]MBB3106966.1 putative MFS family arabinose efflux permease [Psychrobacter luti]
MSSRSKPSHAQGSLSENSTYEQHQNPISWFIFGLMASVTFIGILSELMPSGILPQMTEGLGVEQTQVGFLVGIYALASAIFAIPLISMTLWVNRKVLLLLLLTGFAVSNLVVGLTSSYPLIVTMRIIGGICAGIMWPMIAAYGTALVPENLHGKAITIIMAGNTFGVSLGLPIMTFIGTLVSWRTSFLVLGALGALIALLAAKYLPSVQGEKLTQSNSPIAVLKIPAVWIVLILTLLSVVAHYSTYTYITLLVESIDFVGGISLALLIFGIGSVISVILSAKIIDTHLRGLIVAMLACGMITMLLFVFFRGTNGFAHLAFLLWGLAFGPLVTMYQTAVSKQVTEAKAVATSVQSSVFNFSIMIATWVAGLILLNLPEVGVFGIVYLSILCFIPAIIITLLVKKTLDA